MAAFICPPHPRRPRLLRWPAVFPMDPQGEKVQSHPAPEAATNCRPCRSRNQSEPSLSKGVQGRCGFASACSHWLSSNVWHLFPSVARRSGCVTRPLPGLDFAHQFHQIGSSDAFSGWEPVNLGCQLPWPTNPPPKRWVRQVNLGNHRQQKARTRRAFCGLSGDFDFT